MSRPKKAKVDYFPHMVNHGKTIYAIESKYGNDGYAVWFKLLELLGNTEGHYINCNDKAAWMYLYSYVRLDEDKCMEIISQLSILGAIDKELWKKGIIWSENFINGLSDLYSRRKVKLPSKDDIGKKYNDVDEENYKLKTWCRAVTHRALKSGELEKQPCLICENLEVQAHHLDYTNPLDIEWLCMQHHAEKHVNVDINPTERGKCRHLSDSHPQYVNINPHSIVKDSIVKKSKEEKKKKKKSKEAKKKNLFEEFWKIYPPRNGKKLEKSETLERFINLKEEDIELCLQATKNYADSELVKRGMGIKDPKRFILDGKGKEFWREWIEPEQITKPGTKAIAEPQPRKAVDILRERGEL